MITFASGGFKTRRCKHCHQPVRVTRLLDACCSERCWALLRAKESMNYQPVGFMAGAPALTAEDMYVVWLAQIDRTMEKRANELIYGLAARLRQWRNDGSWQPGYIED